jgi:hypothetical protein
MKLYYVSDNGDLIEINKLDFIDNYAYIVDDDTVIYVWVGLQTSQKKKDITAKIVRRLDKERDNAAKILIMKQKREYGSFLAMMDNLKKGVLPGVTIERRPELKLEKPSKTIEIEASTVSSKKSETEMETNLEKYLQQLKKYRKPEPEKAISEPEKVISKPEEIGLETEIKEAAYYLSLDNYSYNDLCWMLAEKILKYTLRMPSIEDTKKKAEEVFKSSCTYDELCWLNAEMDLLIKKEYLVKESHTFNFK